MAYREVTRVEIEEVVRRWQAGEGLRRIASGTGISRITVRKYVAAAEEMGLFPGGPSPDEEQLSRLAGISQAGPRQVQIPSEEILAPWADQIYQWLTGDRLQVTRIQELLAERGGVGPPIRRCTDGYNGGTGGGAAPERCGWSRAGPGR